MMKKLTKFVIILSVFCMSCITAFASVDYGKYKNKIDIYVEDSKDCILIVKKSFGNDIGIKTYPITDNKGYVSFEMESGKTYDIFLWESLESLKPKCPSLKLSQRSEDKTPEVNQDGYTPLY